MYSIATEKSKFAKIKGKITGKAFIEGLTSDLLVHHEIKNLFVVKPTFHKYTKVDETYINLIKATILDEETWEKICLLID